MSFKMDWHGDKVLKKQKEATKKGLMDAAEHIGEHANKTAPIDEGTLRRSMGTDFNEEDMMSAVFYDTPYARRWHEADPSEVSFRDPNARVKWLEQTIKERQKAIQDYLANAIRAGLR